MGKKASGSAVASVIVTGMAAYRGGWRRCLHVFLLVGVGLRVYGVDFYGVDVVTRGAAGNGAASGAVGGGGIGACTLCSHAVI